MTLLATKISEVVDEAVANNESILWRGILDTQEWKIVAHYTDNEVIVNARRRDGGEGVPE